jgi:hypothetical protein
MSASISAGDFRVCPSCGSRNKAAHRYCVRCSAPLHAPATAAPGAARAARPGSTRMMRFVLAAGVVAAIAVGLIVRTVFRATLEVPAISEDVRADSARTVAAPPPPPVSGWYPGGNVPVEPDTAPRWSSDSFRVARPNPYDVPGDPNASMVGIAPRAPRVRAARARQRVFTDDDLLETREAGWSTLPAPELVPTRAPEPVRPQTPPPEDAERRDEIAKRESKLNDALSRLDAAQERLHGLRAQARVAEDEDARESLEDALEDVDDAQRDAAKATRKLEEARRRRN